jgi:hypothetical protein
MIAALHAYEVALEPARQRLAARDELRMLTSPDWSSDPNLLHAFLIQWASLSLQLHEPVEQFLAESSRRCAEVGESKLAMSLLYIAAEAIEVYRTLADDTRTLAQLWNNLHARGTGRLPYLDMTSLLTQPATQSIRRTHEHHREIVLGSNPWAELAVTFEMHSLLASIAEPARERAARLLGEEVRLGLRGLQKLGNHAGTQVLTGLLAGFLTANPERHDAMVEAGTRTLDLYGDFLLECCIAGFNLSSWQARQHA